MSFKIKHTSTGHLKKLKEQMKAGKVAVGLPKGKSGQYEDGSTVIEVAAWNEFGTERIPERSFIRVPVQQNKEKYMALAKKQAKLIYAGKTTTENALGILGTFMSDKMKSSFTDNDWEANSDITINGGWMTSPNGKPFYVKGKGSSNPLMSTGQLRNSITYQIVKDK